MRPLSDRGQCVSAKEEPSRGPGLSSAQSGKGTRKQFLSVLLLVASTASVLFEGLKIIFKKTFFFLPHVPETPGRNGENDSQMQARLPGRYTDLPIAAPALPGPFT